MSDEKKSVWERLGLKPPTPEMEAKYDEIIRKTREGDKEARRKVRAKALTARALVKKKKILAERAEEARSESEKTFIDRYGGWILLAFLLSMGLTWAARGAYQTYHAYHLEFDAAGRDALAAKFLGQDHLSGGFYASRVFHLSFSPAIYGEEVELIDRPPQADGRAGAFNGRSFTYVQFGDEELIERQLMRNLRRADYGLKFKTWVKEYELEGREPVIQGHFNQGVMAVDYVVQRAVVKTAGQKPSRSLIGVLALDCPDGRTRMGLIVEPDPNPAGGLEPARLGQTLGEEAYLRGYVGQFLFCGG